MRYCIFCGVEIPGDARYCQVCGKEQPKDTQTEVDAQREERGAESEAPTGLAALLQSPRKLIVVGASAFLAVLLVCTLLMLLFLR